MQKNKLYTVVILLIATLFCSCNSKEPNEIVFEEDFLSISNQNITSDFNDEVKLGQGVNTVLGRICSDCILYNPDADSTETTTIKPGLKGATLTYFMEEFESSELLIKKMNIEARAKLGIGIFKGSASFELYNKIVNKKFSYFLLIEQKIEFPAEILRREIIDSSLKNKALSSFPDFATQCGNKFIRGRRTGGIYKAIVEINSNSQEEYNQTKALVKARFRSISGSGSMSLDHFQSIELVTSQKSTNLMILRNGTIDTLPSIKELKESFRNFPKQIEKVENRCITSLLYGDYEALIGVHSVSDKFNRFEKLETTLLEIAEKKEIALLNISEVNKYLEEGSLDIEEKVFYNSIKNLQIENLKECERVLNYYTRNYLLDSCNWDYISKLSHISKVEFVKKSSTPSLPTKYKALKIIGNHLQSEPEQLQKKDGISRYLLITGFVIDRQGNILSPINLGTGNKFALFQCSSLEQGNLNCKNPIYTTEITTSLIPIYNADCFINIRYLGGSIMPSPTDPIRYTIIEKNDSLQISRL